MLSITKSILLVSLITLIWAHTDPYHTCIHDQLDFEPQFIDVPIAQPPEDARSLQDAYQNIRILFDYTGGGFNNTPTDFQNYIKNVILPPVKNIFEASLKVMPVVGNLTGQKLSTMCSGSITVPAIYNSVGVPADLVLFVDVVNDLSQTYAAFAGPCVMSTTNRRPLFGRIVYNMARIAANTNSATIDKDLSITLHESTHALGFTNGLYTYYINPTTNQALTGHYFTKVVNGESVQVLNVEPLTSRLRTYFNCPSLEGAYLENEGSSGSKNSHFERRIFYNEYMTASTIADARMTEFTLALLEGTGWYKADYSRAEPMTWGKGKGCSFLNSPCVDKTTQVSTSQEFCSPLKTMMCSWTGRGAGPCGASTLRTNTALTSSYNWWGNNTVVNDAFSDNCPIGDIYSNLDCEDERNSATATLPGQEFYGYGGKCFIATLYPPGRVAAPYGYCFKQTCELQADGNYFVKVAVGSNVVTCTNTDQITVPGLGGLLYCPDPNVFCGRQNAEGYCRKGCAARGTCVNKQCQCNDGWGGYDCTRQIYADKCAKCAGQDPFKTTCFGDSCVCNPSDNTCMCQLGLKTGSDCNGVGTPASTPTQTPTNTNTTTTNTTSTTTNTTTTAPAQNTTTSSNATTTTPTQNTTTSTNTTSTSNSTTTNTTTTTPIQNTTTSTNTTSTSNSTTTPKTNTTTTTNTTNTTTTTPTQNTTTTTPTTTTPTTTTPTTTTNTTSTSTNTTTTPRTNTTTTTNTTNTTTTTPTQNTTTTPTTTTNTTSTSNNTTTTPTTTNTTNTTTTTTPTTTNTTTSTNTTTNTTNTTPTTPTTTINTTTTITNTTDPKTNTTVITNTTITTNSTTTPTTSGNTTTITTTNRTTTTTTNSTATTTKTTVTTTTKTITTTNNTSTNSTNAVPSNTAVGTKQEGEANVGERDGGNTDNENTVKEPSSGINLGLIIGAAVGGIIFVSVGLYFGIRFAKNWKKNRATRAPSIKKSNSIANPALRRQMTNNQTKYAYVP